MCRQTYIISTRSTFEVGLFYNTYSHTITISHGIIFVKIITLFFNDTPPKRMWCLWTSLNHFFNRGEV